MKNDPNDRMINWVNWVGNFGHDFLILPAFELIITMTLGEFCTIYVCKINRDFIEILLFDWKIHQAPRYVFIIRPYTAVFRNFTPQF